MLVTTSLFSRRLNKDKILLFEDVLLNYSGYHITYITIFGVENVYQTIISHASDFRKTIFNVYTFYTLYTTKLRKIPRIRKSGTCQMSLFRLKLKKIITLVCRFQHTQQFTPYTPPQPPPPPLKKMKGLSIILTGQGLLVKLLKTLEPHSIF